MAIFKSGYQNITILSNNIKRDKRTMKTSLKSSHTGDHDGDGNGNGICLIDWNKSDLNRFESESFDIIIDIYDKNDKLRLHTQSRDELRNYFATITRLLSKTLFIDSAKGDFVNKKRNNSIGGKFLLVSKLRKINMIKLNCFEWNVKRVSNFAKNIPKTVNEISLFLHVCNKWSINHHLTILKQSVEKRQRLYELATNINNIKRIENKYCLHKSLISIQNWQKLYEFVLEPYSKCTNNKMLNTNEQLENQFVMIEGVVKYKRKFGKTLIFYEITLLDEYEKVEKEEEEEKNKNKNKIENNNDKTFQCVAELAYINALNNNITDNNKKSELQKEFENHNLIRCDDHVKMYGILRLTDKQRLSLWIYQMLLVAYYGKV